MKEEGKKVIPISAWRKTRGNLGLGDIDGVAAGTIALDIDRLLILDAQAGESDDGNAFFNEVSKVSKSKEHEEICKQIGAGEETDVSLRISRKL